VDITWFRDLIIVIYGILGIVLAVPLFILIVILYKKLKEILVTVEKTTAEAKEVIGTVKSEFVSPISKVMVVMQTIRETASLVSEFMKKQQEGPHE
jgi:hypothetical protein